MSRFNSLKFIGQGVALLLAGLACYGSVVGVRTLVMIDAFGSLRATADGPLGSMDGVVLNDLTFRVYEEGRLIAEAEADRMRLRRDRSATILEGVSNGKFFSEDKEYAFSAGLVEHLQFQDVITAKQGILVEGDDLEVRSSRFTFDASLERLTVPTGLTGTIQGGKFTAANLTYDIPAQRGSLGPARWIGQAEVMDERREWDVEAPNGLVTVRDQLVSADNARATNGELIVKADFVEWNRQTNVLTATGNVRYFGERLDLRCDRLVLYDEEERAVLTGNVLSLIKAEDRRGLAEEPLPSFDGTVPQTTFDAESGPNDEDLELLRDTDSLEKYPTMLRSDRVVYFYTEGSRRATVEGSPVARQDLEAGKWRIAWAHSAEYDGESDLLRLNSSGSAREVRMVNSVGDDVRALWVEIDTQEEDDLSNMRAFNAQFSGFATSEVDEAVESGQAPPANPRASASAAIASSTFAMWPSKDKPIASAAERISSRSTAAANDAVFNFFVTLFTLTSRTSLLGRT